MAEYREGPSDVCGGGGDASGEGTSMIARAAERARQAAREQLHEISERRRLLAEASYDDGVEMALEIVARDKNYARASETEKRERAVAIYLDTVARHSNMNLLPPPRLPDMYYNIFAAGDASLHEFENEAGAEECADEYLVVEDFDDSDDEEEEAPAPVKPVKPGTQTAAKEVETDMESQSETDTDSDIQAEVYTDARAPAEEEGAYDADESVESDEEC